MVIFFLQYSGRQINTVSYKASYIPSWYVKLPGPKKTLHSLKIMISKKAGVGCCNVIRINQNLRDYIEKYKDYYKKGEHDFFHDRTENEEGTPGW